MAGPELPVVKRIDAAVDRRLRPGGQGVIVGIAGAGLDSDGLQLGVGGEGYLASPAVVVSSALAGYMAPPGELGIEWNAESFAV